MNARYKQRQRSETPDRGSQGGDGRLTLDFEHASVHPRLSVKQPVVVLAHDGDDGHPCVDREVKRALLERE